jgi:hypothetical protein
MENEQEKTKIGLGERMKGVSPDFTTSTNKMVERYLSNNLPDIIQRYDLALIKDLSDVDSSTNKLEHRVHNLEEWKRDAGTKIADSSRRLELLEKKHGVKG